MPLWPILLVALGGLVYVLNDAFPDALRDGDATARVLFLVLLLAFIIGFGGRLRRTRIGPALKMALAWVGIFLLVVLGYSFRDDASAIFERVRGEISPTAAISRANGEVELRKARDGHFRAVAEVNGQEVRMLVDTGASAVVLAYEDAARLGLDPQNLAFTRRVTTANGEAFVAAVTLDSVAVGAIALRDVRAAVAQTGAMDASLLGMSFLGRLEETSFRRDRLILRN